MTISNENQKLPRLSVLGGPKSPVEVAIELDLPADRVSNLWRYWELEGMYGLVQVYEEAKYDVHDLLRLHRIAKERGMEKQDIINVLDFVKHNQLRTLQWRSSIP